MTPLSGIGEVYLVCAGIGSIYLIASFAMGQTHGGGGHGGAIGHGHAGSSGHGLLGGHAGPSGHGLLSGQGHASAHGSLGHGPAAGHGTPGHGGAAGHGAAGRSATTGNAGTVRSISGSTNSGHGTTAHSGTALSSGANGHSGTIGHGTGGSQDSYRLAGDGASSGNLAHHLGHAHAELHTGPHHAVNSQSGFETGPVQALPKLASKVGKVLLTISSPMTISTFLAFFGISGLIILQFIPQLGIITALPAFLVALFISRAILQLMSWGMVHLHVSNVTRADQLIGLASKVTISIPPGEVGQISYVANGMRAITRARAMDATAEFSIGDRVIISDYQNRVAFVELWTDDFFPDDQNVIHPQAVKEQDKQGSS